MNQDTKMQVDRGEELVLGLEWLSSLRSKPAHSVSRPSHV